VWLRDAAADPVAATMRLAPLAGPQTVDKAVAAAERWLSRLSEADPAREEQRAGAVGARVVTRVDHEWPPAFDVMGARAPYALWVRGGGDVNSLYRYSVALVGSRAATGYGEHVAAEIAGGLSDAGWCVISGGAYGIDAAAHRAALTGVTPTVAVMAGGVDRLYPAGNFDLLSAVMEKGVVLSEVPVGFAPHRSRFLARNRLIAAADATCVVEAAARSGALNTVNHALAFGRPVGAVPGPVTSASSQGCHALIRDGQAVLVAEAQHVMELAEPIGSGAVREGRRDGVAVHGQGADFGDASERAAFDAIAPRGSRVEAIAKSAGLGIGEALGALMGLELAGLAHAKDGVWRRSATKTS
jgi:DNA processing protein